MQKPRTIEDDQPPTNIALPHEGLAYRFPFDTEKKTYPFFDPIAQKPFDANYDGEEDVNGLTTYRFTQNVGYDADGKLVEPVKYASLYDDDEDADVTARASLWGLPGDPNEPITMTRYYAAQRTFWVDPVSGTIVKAEEHGYHYYAREPLKPEVTFVDYTVTSNEETVESQVADARDERDRVALWGRILPITFTAMGLVALVGGALLGSFSLRAESALIDPGLDERRPAASSAGADPTPDRCRRRGRDREAAHTAAVGLCRRTDRSDRTGFRRCPAYALALALVVTAPLLAPGYLLLRDAVSTPRSYLSDAALGLSEAAPRALPQDFAVALASHVLDGGVVVKALLMAGLWLAGWGAARLAAALVPEAGVAGQCVAVTIAIWNPYVAERLLQGHWSLLVGYGCLPWVATAMLRLRTSSSASAVCGAGVLDRAGRADADRADAGRDGRGGVCLRAGWRAAAVAVRGGRPRRRGAGGAALAGRPRRCPARCRHRRPRVSRRSRPAPSRASARWAAWPASAGSGTPTPYPPRGQRFSRSSPRWCCSPWWRSGCRWRCADPPRCRC